MHTPDTLVPSLNLDAETLGIRLVERLSSIQSYSPVLGLLVSSLCARIGRDDAAASCELWRLAQGLHFGGAFSVGNLERLRLRLNVLLPQEGCE